MHSLSEDGKSSVVHDPIAIPDNKEPSQNRASSCNFCMLIPSLMCMYMQGRREGNKTLPAGVLRVDPQTGQCNWILNYFLGLQFNSPHGPSVTSDGVIFFADATQGYSESQV